MVVIVLRNEICPIHQTHILLQTGVNRGNGYLVIRQVFHLLYQGLSTSTHFGQNFRNWRLTMRPLFSGAVCWVCGRQHCNFVLEFTEALVVE